MNRFIVFSILLLIQLLSSSKNLYSQVLKKKEIGIPFITNYTTQIYRAYSQNWSIVQDKKGIIYVANGNGILEFDGVTWNLININNYLPVFALAIDSNNIIWVGSALEFGYLAPNDKGIMTFHSINHLIEPKERKFSTKGKIFATKYGVFYKTDTRLFRYYKGKVTVEHTTEPSNCFIFNDNFYLWQKGIGLQIFDNGIFRLVRDGEKFANREILFILKHKKKSGFLLIDQEGIYHFEKLSEPGNYVPLKLKKVHSQVDAYLNKNWLFDAISLKNGNYALATLRDGTFIIDITGSIIQHIDKRTGTINNTHLALMESQFGSLWIAMDNGIARAEINSNITYWNDAYGLNGSVACVTRYQEKIYAGTYQGLFVMQPSYYDVSKTYLTEIFVHDFQFVPVNPIFVQCWDLLTIRNSKNEDTKLLAATSDGLYEIIKYNEGKKISDGKFFKIFRSRKNPELIYAGTNNGIIVYKYSEKTEEIKYLCKISGIKDKVISFEEDDKGRIWAGVRYNGIVCIKLKNEEENNKEECNYEIMKFDTSDGLPKTEDILIKKIFGEIIFMSEQGNFSFKEKSNTNTFPLKGTFVENNTLTNGYKLNDYFLYSTIQDDLNQVWMQAISKKLKENFIVLAIPSKKHLGKFTYITEPFRVIPYTTIFSIYPEIDGKVWFGGDDGLFLFNPSYRTTINKEYSTLIRKISLGKDSIIKYGSCKIKKDTSIYGIPIITFDNNESQYLPISYDNNSIIFEFTAPTFFDEKNNMYSYILEGFDDKWSEWTKETRKEYTNLPPGNYTFKVKAKNIYQIVSKEAQFSFTIKPPWYFTTWAYAMYFLLFILILYTITWYSNSRLRKSKERLEQIVRERTFEIITQKEIIEKEKEKTEKLLLNILPKTVAEELKKYDNAKVQHYKFSTILFADFKGFTTIAEKMKPQTLIRTLNKFFIEFDEATNRFRIEKIKTIGDAYMCVGGVPEENYTNPVDVVLYALTMKKIVEKYQKEDNLSNWEIRIGINTGEVIAGVIGKKKYAYDIFGDAVNVAARMEASSEPGKINVSETTYKYIKELFECTYRGSIPAKNKGNINMYFVEKIKEGYHSDDEGIIPNENFWEKYEQIIKNYV